MGIRFFFAKRLAIKVHLLFYVFLSVWEALNWFSKPVVSFVCSLIIIPSEQKPPSKEYFGDMKNKLNIKWNKVNADYN